MYSQYSRAGYDGARTVSLCMYKPVKNYFLTIKYLSKCFFIRTNSCVSSLYASHTHFVPPPYKKKNFKDKLVKEGVHGGNAAKNLAKKQNPTISTAIPKVIFHKFSGEVFLFLQCTMYTLFNLNCIHSGQKCLLWVASLLV